MIKNYAVVGFLMVFLSVTVDSSCATDTPSDFDSILSVSQKELLEQKDNLFQSPTEAIGKATDFVFWTASWDDLNASCEKKFMFYGSNLAVKLGFVRGAFDSYSQTYKAEPVVALRNIDTDLVYPFIRVGQRVNNGWNTASFAGRVFVEFQPQSVIITDYYDSSKTLTVPYAELLRKWETHAAAFCSWHFGKKYCLVPQRFWDGAYHQNGFILSEGAPLFSATSRPQDYVGLFRQEPTTYVPNYRQTVYSLALRMAFILSPNLQDTWELRPMTSAEVGEAMVDRMSTMTFPIRTSSTLITRGSVSH